MVLLAVMANVTWVALAAAWEPKPAVALLVVLAGAEVGQRLSFLDGGVFGDALTIWHHYFHHTL